MRTRSGSALLVVLGMLAFMVISGLAFAVFMRSTRMSSSFTRRTVATRQLAKAALAEAIDQIDRAVANDPHPGVRGPNQNDFNHWVGRVLVTGEATVDNNGNKTLKRPSVVAEEIRNGSKRDGNDDTVPVLSMEALAYLPPCLVNEARYYGQRTPSAAWQSFWFDAGRYAFIALDVSDYFDVNRVLVTEARSSNPARRISLAHLFEGGGEDHSSAPSAAATFENAFLSKFRTPADDGKISFPTVPFVSLADFNLALGAGSAGFASPAWKYLTPGGAGDTFYGCSPGSTAWEAYSQMTFVTDSLAAREAHTDGTDTFDLDVDKDQPYRESFFNQSLSTRSASSILDDCISQPAWKYLCQKRVSAAGMLALADYLDKDDVPTSLAIPTTERVPMICAVRPMPQDLKIVVSREFSDEKEVTEGENHYKQRTVTVRYKLDGEVIVDSWTAFPFRDQAGFKSSYQADCRVSLFLSSKEMLLRTSLPADQDALRLTSFSANNKINDGVATLCKQNSACSTQAVKSPEDAVKQVGEFNMGNVGDAFAGSAQKGLLLAQLTYRWKGELVPDSDPPQYTYPEPTVDNCELVGAPTCDYSPLGSDGKVDGNFSKTVVGNTKGTYLKDLKLPGSVYFNLATWVAVRNGNGKVVDLVPACMSDDSAYNGMDYNEDFTDIVFSRVSGANAPLLKFAGKADGKTDFLLMEAADFLSEQGKELKIELVHKDGIVVRDPRYNYAPENWFAAGATIDAQGAYWRDNTGCGDAGCDGDIFMTTSDQEKLQSVGELAFIPRFTDLDKTPSDTDVGDRIKNPERTWTDYPAKGSEAQANMMWRTFNPFDAAENGQGFEDMLEVFHHHGKGLRVNPYSDSTNVIMAAFANTPISWRVASENDDDSINTVANDQADVTTFNKKYAWNAYNTDGYKISWADLKDVAGKFISVVQDDARNGDSWETALLDVFTANNGDNETKLCGIDLEEDGRFYSVDKKTLWGFWQNAFEPQQQLFLVFIRSEPTLLGGGIAGVTPPQLGAKAVAVVWRNPNKTSGSNNGYDSNGDIIEGYKPHQTRVLFYRQFE